MKSSYKILAALMLGGAGASLAVDEPWIAYVNSQMFNTTNPDSGVDGFTPGSRELSIEANGGRFWIGKSASAYCPSGVDKLDCSVYKGDKTIFVGANDFGDGVVSLNVVVPGGQRGTYLPLQERRWRHRLTKHISRTVYIAPDGALSYTQAHSASMPQGSETEAFGRAPLTVGANAQLVLWSPNGDFEACPVGDAGTYQIYVRVANNDRIGCTLIMIRTRSANGTSSWQY
jgi:hypothetical protein